MSEELFREDSYARECRAKVTAINDRGGIVLDRTVFYPTGGGQPGDAGTLRLADGSEIEIATTVYGDDRSIVQIRCFRGGRRNLGWFVGIGLRADRDGQPEREDNRDSENSFLFHPR